MSSAYKCRWTPCFLAIAASGFLYNLKPNGPIFEPNTYKWISSSASLIQQQVTYTLPGHVHNQTHGHLYSNRVHLHT